MNKRSGLFWDAMEGRAPLPRAAATLGLEPIHLDADSGSIDRFLHDRLKGTDLRAFAGFSCIEPGQRQELVSQARKAFHLGETRAQGLLIFDTRPGWPKRNFQLRAEARQGRAKLV